MATEHQKIDITGINLALFVKTVYALSKPVGMGFLHYKEGDMSDAEAESIVKTGYANSPSRPIFLDYVHGRCCKMRAFEENGKLLINNIWQDHSTDDLAVLLTTCGFAHKLDEILVGVPERIEE